MSLSFKLGTLEPKSSISRLKIVKDDSKPLIVVPSENKLSKNETEINISIHELQQSVHKSTSDLYKADLLLFLVFICLILIYFKKKR